MFVAYTGIHTHMLDIILTNNTGNGILHAQGFFLHLLVCTDAYSAHLVVTAYFLLLVGCCLATKFLTLNNIK